MGKRGPRKKAPKPQVMGQQGPSEEDPPPLEEAAQTVAAGEVRPSDGPTFIGMDLGELGGEDDPEKDEFAISGERPEAEPDPRMDEFARIASKGGPPTPCPMSGGVVITTIPPTYEPDVPPVPRETDPEPQVIASPTGILRQIVLGNVAPEGKPGPLVCGAKVAFSYRPNKWKDAEALIVAKVGDDGTIFIDLEVGGELARMVPYGSGTRCWKFRE